MRILDRPWTEWKHLNCKQHLQNPTISKRHKFLALPGFCRGTLTAIIALCKTSGAPELQFCALHWRNIKGANIFVAGRVLQFGFAIKA